MCFSVVCLCMDESCLTGHFLPEPPPHPNVLKFFLFQNNILHNKCCVSHKSICCYCLKVTLAGNNFLILVYSCIWKNFKDLFCNIKS